MQLPEENPHQTIPVRLAQAISRAQKWRRKARGERSGGWRIVQCVTLWLATGLPISSQVIDGAKS